MHLYYVSGSIGSTAACSERGERSWSTKSVTGLVVSLSRLAEGEAMVVANFLALPWSHLEGCSMSHRSVSTVMADVARKVFGSTGRGIVWAVVDSGIDGTHQHFRRHSNLELPPPLTHRDFTVLKGDGDPLVDRHGHGTHVAGIIAGEITEEDGPVWGEARYRTDWGTEATERQQLTRIAGMAPECKLLSLKVLEDQGQGRVSDVISAIAFINEVNGYGRRMLVHGVNLGIGFDYEPEWFACGQSPLCIEVDRLVKTGVVVVVPAGNTGFGYQKTLARGTVAHSLPLSIDDPGNAELAITVGATHRDMPQLYGVSYFSSRGPTADGRSKPDVVAPGERITSCWSTQAKTAANADVPASLYRADSGTAMAAAHVSGLVAAYLSVRREQIGEPLTVKEVFRQTAVDLKRHADFQGRGLVNLMRALQPVVDVGMAVPTVGSVPSRTPAISDDRLAREPAMLVAENDHPAKGGSPAHRRAASLFCSYAHEDVKLREQFERSISHLMQERLIEVWHDGEIVPGKEWRAEIDRALAVADLIILLVSPDFMQSPFINEVELKRAIERHQTGKARVVPVILRPVSTLGALAKLEALPRKAKPLTTWKNRDSAWVDVAQGLERVLKDMLGS
jgi:serine protease AprX